MQTRLVLVLLALIAGSSARQFIFKNKCNYNIWVGAQGIPTPAEGGFFMGPGAERSVEVDNKLVAGRFWPRTNCKQVNGKLQCMTGQCYIAANQYVDDGTKCNPANGGQPPYTIAEMTLQLPPFTDYYDLSLVDGYTVPMKMYPTPGNSGTRLTNDNSKFNCGTSTCAGFDYSRCPNELKLTNDQGEVIACMSICSAINSATQRAKHSYLQNMFNSRTKTGKPMVDLVCCSCGAGTGGCADANSNYCCSPHNSDPNERGGKCFVEEWPLASNGMRYDRVFKDQCDEAYSWQFDDFQSTYQCIGAGYTMEFCPTGGSTPPPPATSAPTPPPAATSAQPATSNSRPPPNQCGPWIGGNGAGLKGTYYRDTTFSNAVANTLDPVIAMVWGLGGPHGLSDNFSIRWTGFFLAPRTGTHTFWLESDDGSRLFINNVQVVDHFSPHGMSEKSGTIALNGGVKYPMKIEYVEYTVDAGIRLYYSVCDTGKQFIPAALLFATSGINVNNAYCQPFGSAGDGLLATYLDGALTGVSTPVYTKTDSQINFEFKELPTNITGPTFSIKWAGVIQAMFSQKLTFVVDSTGASWSFTLGGDGSLLSMASSDKGTQSVNQTIDFNAGAFSILKFDFTGAIGSSVKLSWTSDCLPLEAVPQSQLFSSLDLVSIATADVELEDNSALSFGVCVAFLIALLF
jgi:hypothetical protein